MTDGGEQTEYAVVIVLVRESGPVRINAPLPDTGFECLVIPCESKEGMVDLHYTLLERFRLLMERGIMEMHIDQLQMDVNMKEIKAIWIAVDGKKIPHRVLPGWRIEYDW